ncbi:hypothetical protein TEA_022313 [Camellia sinensis var. sinensis]|uniref:Protein kinase domain-containing protein n=1 Tax=Camellia sinensis var. sinensis TaxID=542762 RepID=A0A4S4D934_CAMSN|nr:hypothetical protein TEA_022313 [Camellia sinensis var. sinensis]
MSSSRLMGNDTDRLSLLAIKAKIGVTCSHRHQRVTALDLQSQDLVGSISLHIGNLSFLRELRLQNNSFGNEIAPEIGRLPRFQILLLNNNLIGGQIPVNISRCANLVYINFSYNRLVGEVPVELGFLLKLVIVIICINNLTGSISPFANLSSLRELFLDTNYFDGSIPDGFDRLKNLQKLALSTNRLSGVIPASLFNHSSLTTFDVTINQIQGSLPWDLGITLPNLEFFSISENQFTGSILVSISNASKLHQLQLGPKKLTGMVPSLARLQNLKGITIADNHLGFREADDLNFIHSLINATNLQHLGVGPNNFGCKFPKSIGNLSRNLEYLYIGHNQIFRSIPPRIVNLVGLQSLDMQVNQLTGTIPIEIGKVQNLHQLILYSNSLSCNIPSSLGNLSLLSELNLESNNFRGNIPPSLGNCRTLQLLFLSQNNLNGTIPKQVVSISSLSIYLDLSQNQLSGSLPIEVEKLINLGYLDVSKNLLSGEISSTLGSFTNLETLHLGNNFFNGTIPSSLSCLRGLSELDLMNNSLSGEILVLEIEEKILLQIHQKIHLLRVSYQTLVKATDGFSSFNLIGVGSFGLVYKGVIDGRIGQTPIVHCDLKPSNILLDKDMTGHVGDFGLAKFLADHATHDLSANETSSVGIRGTIEYGMGSEVSAYSDIYSFGILVLEMFTGKRPIDEMFKDGLSLHIFVKEALPGSVSEILDPILFQTEGEEEESFIRSEKIVECLSLILEIGVDCSSELPRERTNINNVAGKLHFIKDTLLGFEIH